MARARDRHYFRRWPADQDPRAILDPANQNSTPWGEPEHGACDKCQGTGVAHYRCGSCLEREPDPECPSCGGRVEFEDVCPTCEGNGQIDRTRREGVSVFPSLEGLRRYIEERGSDFNGCVVVELEGELTADRDLDADAGALLIRPTQVVATHRFDPGRISPRT